MKESSESMRSSSLGKKNSRSGLLSMLLILPMLLLTLYGLAQVANMDSSSVVKQSSFSLGSGVMLQGFYWDVPEGNWYNAIYDQIPKLKNWGIDSIWLPPPSKGASGGYSMGYDPFDYYDLGEYYQKGITRTRFGTKAELTKLIKYAHKYEISVLADIVMNHNSGGDSEWNPYENSYTYTNFMNVQSGRFLRNYTAFHPCEFEEADEGAWGGFPDLCHANPYVHDELLDWGTWLKQEIGFDGWRFDYVKGYHPFMIRDWMKNVGGWGVVEYWDGDKENVKLYLDAIENTASAFDFPLFYTLKELTDSGGYYDMNKLRNVYSVASERPFNAVTFVENHDTNREGNGITKYKSLAYAYILTHEGYPMVFWKDLFDPVLGPNLQKLMLIHNQFASGTTIVRYTDNDLYIAERMGDPGLLVLLNDGDQWLGATVETKWRSTTIIDVTGKAENEFVDENGFVEVWAPPKGFTVYTTRQLEYSEFTPTSTMITSSHSKASVPKTTLSSITSTTSAITHKITTQSTSVNTVTTIDSTSSSISSSTNYIATIALIIPSLLKFKKSRSE